MNGSPSRVLELVEYESIRLPEPEMAEEDARLLWEAYPSQVAVESPSFKNSRQWELRSLGWVGYIPLSERLGLLLRPKVPLENLFGMFEYAYQIDMKFLKGLFDAATLAEFYEQLALVLARRVLDRSRRGLYRCYVRETESLPYMRGALDLRDRIRRPWSPALQCEYEEHTADVAENQILAWTLFVIARSGLCSDRVLPTVRRAYHTLEGAAATMPFTASACVCRAYNRLSEDYRPLHALCRFFLDHFGASHERGDRRMLPFIVDMNRLFERFVAEWLLAHVPGSFELRFQEAIRFGSRDDLCLRLTEMGRLVFGYADEIFTLGRELVESVKGRPTGRPLRFTVGVSDALPKLVAYRLLEPALTLPQPVRLVVHEQSTEKLLAALALNELDVVLTDRLAPPGTNVRVFTHLLGDCGATLFAAPGLAVKYRRRFPSALDGAPFLLPGESSSLRRALEQWFEQQRIWPRIIGEFHDSTLIKVFGQAGKGIFVAPSIIEASVRKQYGVSPIGRLDSVRERFYAVSAEWRLKHPAVIAVTESARRGLFG